MVRNMNWYKFWDHIGVVVWLFLIADSVYYLREGIIDYRVLLRLLAGICGLLIDGYLVFFYKEKSKGKK